MENAPTPNPEPKPIIINWALTEQKAQQVIDAFDALIKAGGLQNARIALPLAEDLMQTAIKAKEAREAEAKAGPQATN